MYLSSNFRFGVYHSCTGKFVSTLETENIKNISVHMNFPGI